MKTLSRLLASVCIALSAPSGFAQVSPDSLILTREANDRWFASFANSSFDSQLVKLRERILLDTNVFVHFQMPVCGSFFKPVTKRTRHGDKRQLGPGNKFTGQCRIPVMAVCSKTSRLLDTTGDNPEQVVEFSSLLTQEHIQEVRIFRGAEAGALFGTRGADGVIYVIFRNSSCDQFALTMMMDEGSKKH